MIMRRVFLLVLCCLVALKARGTNDTVRQDSRPKVGLVLAGGGARGASFIGVLKYFEELDIPVDYVIGTSMGSIIGGVYAMGYSPNEMADIIASVEWSKFIGNSTDRSLLSTEFRKRHSTQLINIPFNIKGIFRDGLIESFLGELPSAYVSNNDVENLFNELCQGYQDSISFNDLPIPFACIATDIVAGEEVVLRSGSLPKAMRASMAFPAIFSPVVIDGKLLYDGGLVNIFPSDVLREMGADIIIGIEFTNEKFFIGESIPSVAKLVDYMYNFAIHVKRDENKKLCDLLIKPNTSEFGPLSFSAHAIDTLIERGYQEAKKYHEPLMSIKRQVDSIAGHPVGKTLNAPKATGLEKSPVFVSHIVMNGVPDHQAKWLIREGRLHENRLLDDTDIHRASNRYRGTGAFDVITHNLTPTDTTHNEYKLQFNLHPKSPDLVGFGAHYDTEEGAALLFGLGLNEKSLSGFKLNLTGRLSFQPKLTATATYALFPLVNFNLSYEYRNQLMKVSVPHSGHLNLRLQKQEIKAYVSQYQILNLDVVIGLSYAVTDFPQVNMNDFADDTTGMSVLPVSLFDRKFMAGPYFSVTYDNLDHDYFASKGISANLAGRLYFDTYDTGNKLKDIGFSFTSYLTPRQGPITVIPQLYSLYTISDMDNTSQWNLLGGEVMGRYSDRQLPFVGINHVVVSAKLTTVLRCDLRYNFYGKHYLTGIYNYALCIDPPLTRGDGLFEAHYSGFGLRYSFNSLVGPISMTAHYSNFSRQLAAYISLGYIF